MFTLDGSQINFFIAYIAGFLTFFASCLLPLVPTYLAYLSGISLTTNLERDDDSSLKKKWKIVKIASFFVFGFILTFIILGLTATQLSGIITPYRNVIAKLSGVLFIILGLFMLGVFKHRLFSQERKVDVHNIFHKQRHLHAFLTGIAFGFGWSPCIGPVLGIILYWASQAQSTMTGIALLTFYGIGLGTPFILVAFGFEKIIPLLKKYGKISHYATILSGITVLLAGLFLILGQFHTFSLFLVRLFHLNALSI